MRFVILLSFAVATTMATTTTHARPSVAITELMASGEGEDWIELLNSGREPVDLSGWSLTDDRRLPSKWSFPSTTIEPGAYLLVHASGDNRRDPAGALHTNFELNRHGEYLGLFEPGDGESVGSVHFEFFPFFPRQSDGHSFGVGPSGELEFFQPPTPGAPNQPGFPGVASAPALSRPSGVFTGQIDLSMTIADGHAIRYTLDGSEPGPESTLYTEPFPILSSTFVSARGFFGDLSPSSTVTRTFVELDGRLVNTGSNVPIVILATLGAEIDQDAWTRAFTAIVDVDGSGRARLAGEFSFEGEAAVKVRGSSSTRFPKPSYALEIRDDRGRDRDVPLLGMPAESDWVLHGPYSDKSLMRNYLAYAWSNAIGRYATRCRFVELYLDSCYEGVYVLTEKIKRGRDRVDVAKDGGFIVKKDRTDPGDVGLLTERGTRLQFVHPKEEDLDDDRAAEIKGFFDRFEHTLYGAGFKSRSHGYAAFIDIDSFIDHQILVELLKNVDGYRLSTYMHRDRDGKLTLGPIWDYNLALRNASHLDGASPTGWYWEQLQEHDYLWFARLFSDREFAQRHVDRWTELRRGPLSTERVLAALSDASEQVGEAADRNFERWPILGRYVWPNPRPYAQSFSEEVAFMRSWIVERLEWIDRWFADQFAPPPVFNRDGGDVEPGFELVMTAPRGVIYYTTDGSDPRGPGGMISTTARVCENRVELTRNARVFARTRFGSRWSACTTATFVTRTPALTITELMYHPDGGALDATEYEFIELQNVGPDSLDLEGFRFSDGVDFEFPRIEVPPGEFVVVVSNATAFATRYDSSKIHIAGEFGGQLEDDGERVRLTGPLHEPILDFEYDASWYPQTSGRGHSLEIRDASSRLETWRDALSWTPSLELGGTPGDGDSDVVVGWRRPGDVNGDGAVDLSDCLAYLDRMFRSDSAALPCEGATMMDGENAVILDLQADGSADISDAIFLLNHLFSAGPPPLRGTTCARVSTCRSACGR